MTSPALHPAPDPGDDGRFPDSEAIDKAILVLRQAREQGATRLATRPDRPHDDLIRLYFHEMGKVGLLSPEEEVEVARTISDAKTIVSPTSARWRECRRVCGICWPAYPIPPRPWLDH